jgi:molecular chaperone HscB
MIEDYFSIFGISRKFHQSREQLEKKFYELSRALHPDRFVSATREEKNLSLVRMSTVNQAYLVLKNADSRRDYLLKLENIQAPKAEIPKGLAETWFDIQDLLFEDPTSARAKIEVLESQIFNLKQAIQNRMQELETVFDQTGQQQNLVLIAQEVQNLSYLNSLQKDIERIKRNA